MIRDFNQAYYRKLVERDSWDAEAPHKERSPKNLKKKLGVLYKNGSLDIVPESHKIGWLRETVTFKDSSTEIFYIYKEVSYEGPPHIKNQREIIATLTALSPRRGGNRKYLEKNVQIMRDDLEETKV